MIFKQFALLIITAAKANFGTFILEKYKNTILLITTNLSGKVVPLNTNPTLSRLFHFCWERIDEDLSEKLFPWKSI